MASSILLANLSLLGGPKNRSRKPISRLQLVQGNSVLRKQLLFRGRGHIHRRAYTTPGKLRPQAWLLCRRGEGERRGTGVPVWDGQATKAGTPARELPQDGEPAWLIGCPSGRTTISPQWNGVRLLGDAIRVRPLEAVESVEGITTQQPEDYPDYLSS